MQANHQKEGAEFTDLAPETVQRHFAALESIHECLQSRVAEVFLPLFTIQAINDMELVAKYTSNDTSQGEQGQ
jgi:hypothetical protein